jgi:hypothetical protein
VRSETGGSVDLAYGNQGYGDERAANAARKHGIELEAVKLPEARRGFVLLPRRWVIERSFAWTTRLRRRVEDCERYASTLADLHVVAFTCAMLKQAALLAASAYGAPDRRQNGTNQQHLGTPSTPPEEQPGEA